MDDGKNDQRWIETLSGAGSSFTPRALAAKEEFTKLLERSVARREAMSPEARMAEDKAREVKSAQEEWDKELIAGVMRMRLAAQGFDFLSH